MNRIAARDGLEVKTEHLSFEARGIEQEPTRKLGPTATDMERKGQRSERGDENRAICTANDNREELCKLQEEKKVVDLAIEREKRRLAWEATKETLTPDPSREQEKELLAARERTAEEYRAVSSFWQRLFHRYEFEAAYERIAGGGKPARSLSQCRNHRASDRMGRIRQIGTGSPSEQAPQARSIECRSMGRCGNSDVRAERAAKIRAERAARQQPEQGAG